MVCDSSWGMEYHRGLFVAVASVGVVLTLSGCGAQPPAPAPAPVVVANIQYFYVADHSTIVNDKPECNFYEARDLGRQVPDDCCDVSAWPEGSGMSTPGPDARTGVNDESEDQFNCYVRERTGGNTGTYIRNFFGCWNGTILGREECLPAGLRL